MYSLFDPSSRRMKIKRGIKYVSTISRAVHSMKWLTGPEDICITCYNCSNIIVCMTSLVTMIHTIMMNHTRVSSSSVMISLCPYPVRADNVLIRWVWRLWWALSSLWRQKTATSRIRKPSNKATPLVTVTFTTVLMLSLTYVASALELLWAVGPRIPGDISTGGTTPALHITRREWGYRKKMDTESGGC